MRNQIEEIKQKIDIVEIVGQRVKLTKAGKHYKGLCPFHSEKSPSFTVSPELQIYKCFGCGEGGDVFNFLEKFEGMEFSEALKTLAEIAHVKLEKRFNENSSKDILFEINRAACLYYNFLLTRHKSGAIALEYLKNERQIDEKTIDEFKLGYSTLNKSDLYKYLIKRKFLKADILKSGVCYDANGLVIDRFRGRVIFPIYSNSGNVIALAGRILPKLANDRIPKYINSPETEIYHKSSSLYGFFNNRGEIKRIGVAIVVEGEVDMLSSWQRGIKNIVAIKGSALTEEQATIISRVCKKVILALDSDFAGNQAAIRGISEITAKGIDVAVSDFTPYKDPDEAVRADVDFYKERIKKSVSIWDFLIDSVLKKHNVKNGVGKAGASRELAPILNAIADSIVKSHYVQKVARSLSVPTEAVYEQIEKMKNNLSIDQNIFVKEEEKQNAEVDKREVFEKQILGVIFSNNLQDMILENSGLVEFKTHFVNEVFNLYSEYLKNNNSGQFLNKEFADFLPAHIRQGFLALLMENNSEDFQNNKEVDRLIDRLKLLNIKDEMKDIKTKMTNLEKIGKSEDDILILERRLTELSILRARLEN